MYLQEPLYASCVMIHTLGTNSPLTTHLVGTTPGLIEKDKLAACVDTLSKCLRNILEHPGEEKYRSIRCGSRAFKDKVISVAGAELFLQAVGFSQELREFQVGTHSTDTSSLNTHVTQSIIMGNARGVKSCSMCSLHQTS